MTVLETERLRLRPFTMRDGPTLARLYGDDVIMRHTRHGRGLKPEAAKTEARANVTNYTDHWRRLGYGIWAVTDRPTGRLLGRCGLHHIKEVDAVEVLYLLNKTVWGRGLATEAAAAALRFGFEQAGLPRIIAVARPENGPSRKVMEKLGLTYRSTVSLWGFDLAWHEIAREDWPVTQSAGVEVLPVDAK